MTGPDLKQMAQVDKVADKMKMEKLLRLLSESSKLALVSHLPSDLSS